MGINIHSDAPLFVGECGLRVPSAGGGPMALHIQTERPSSPFPSELRLSCTCLADSKPTSRTRLWSPKQRQF